MSVLTRKRLLGTPPNMHPRAVVGKDLFFLDMKRYLAREHENGGWSGYDHDVQSDEDFKFDGKTFRRYTRKILGRDIKRLYFPAAYVGKVANALKEEGYDVFTTDLSDHWVAHLRSLGLRAEKRSFEDIPKERFDAVVCFEPYCIPDPVAYIAILRMMADSLMCIDISVNMPKKFLLGKQLQDLYEQKILRRMRGLQGDDGQILQFGRSYPLASENFDRIAYDYGTKYNSHDVYDAEYLFKFKIIQPTPESSGRALLDLQVIEELNSDQGDRISLIALAKILERPLNEIVASVKRLMNVLNQRLKVEPAVECNEPRFINNSKKFTEEEPRDLVHRITIIE